MFHMPSSSDYHHKTTYFCSMLLYGCQNMTLTKVAYFLYIYCHHFRTFCGGASILQCTFSIIMCRKLCHAMLWSSDSIKFIYSFVNIDQMVQQQKVDMSAHADVQQGDLTNLLPPFPSGKWTENVFCPILECSILLP